MRKRFFGSLFLLFIAAILSGCAFFAPRCTEPGETPSGHYLAGMDLIESGDYEGAHKKFRRALYCNKRYGPAYGGLAIVTAMWDLKPERAFYYLDLACEYSDTNEELFACGLASMRVHTILRPEGWLKNVEISYRKAMKLKVDERELLFYEGREAAMYFMGIAYLEAGRPDLAHERFKDVLNEKPGGRWAEPALRMMKKAEDI